ncbi:winged helix-turn-helix domain-containing protein [Aeromicrobium alkaliterrae]|uniref:Winged helix-turn-helix domain-containing protein n=1 Tax=Aeromicrobium alkaliterrae TaxID=302168 RepID=A0ABP4VUA7_9ACTN
MTSAPERFTVLQARRLALGALGFARGRPTGPVAARHLRSTIDRLGLFQIDSVNVLQRAHYLPLYSRLGPYDTAMLHRAAERQPRRLVEYWAHEAAFVDVRLWPAMAFRRHDETRMWGGPRSIARENPEFVSWVLDEVRRRGPITARAIEEDLPRDRSHWGWNWSEGKQALEYLFYVGQVMAAGRTPQFERLYDLPERVLPPDVAAAPDLSSPDAHRLLIEHAARALGIGTVQCLRDYFRLAPQPSLAAIESLTDEGVLVPVTIDGWSRPAWRHRDAVTPRKVRARALVSPFDPLVFERTRLKQLFDFDYRIEIYVPAEKRVHGYYVLPFLLGDRLVARVDLKHDRRTGCVQVLGAYAEPHAPDHTAVELAAELRLLAQWLGAPDVTVAERGDLAPALAESLQGRPSTRDAGETA